MGYYTRYVRVPVQENSISNEYLNSILPIEALRLKSKRDKTYKPIKLKNINDVISLAYSDSFKTESFTGPDGKEYRYVLGMIVPEKKIRALQKIALISCKLFIGFLIVKFADMQLSKFTINKISKNMKNKRFVEFLKNEIKRIYDKHPDYRPCSGEQFKKTPIYNYMLAEWRNRNSQEIARKLTAKVIDNLISIIVSDAIKLPGSSVFAIPIKAMLTYAGVKMEGMGALYNLVTEINGQTMSMKLILAKEGFKLTDFRLYCFDKYGNMIEKDMKDPPYDSYRLETNDMKEILNKFGKSNDLELFKKEVKRLDGANI